MKNKLVLTSLLLIVTGSITAFAQRKVTVVKQVIEKYHIPKTEIISLSPDSKSTNPSGETEIFIKKFDLDYNAKGELISVMTYHLENDMPTYPFTFYVEMDNTQQIKDISLGTDTSTNKLEYNDNLLETFTYANINFRESKTSRYTYNKNLLPSHISISTIPESPTPTEISLEYNNKRNLIKETYQNESTEYTYDNKQYPFYYLPYGYTVSNLLSSESLMFTNYIQQNNVIKSENTKFIYSIDYTYNQNNLPISARITSVDKNNKDKARLLYEYEFVYMEINASITK
ncbi:MAG: hypothetical protein LBI73_03950 [Myroides sp.]|jgi:hypothetical protein|nr:hypothetical protein [Myroides sp.]